MSAIKLRKYQDDQFVACVDAGERDILVNSPTGSGKTVVAVAVACRVASKDRYCVIITTPQSDVEESFVRAVARGVMTRRGKISGQSIVSRARDGETSVSAIGDHIRSGQGKVLLTTHAALVYAFAKDPDLEKLIGRNHMIVVDEFHHATTEDLIEAPGTKIGKVVTVFRDRRAKVVGFTATAFRADGLDVTTVKTKVLFRSWVQHMEEGFCPRNVEASAVSFVGPQDIDMAAEQMCETWKNHKRPKIIIRVPHVPGEAANSIQSIKERFEKEGARVLDVSGSATEDIRRIKLAMDHEESCRYVDSKYDIIIGCNRVREAFNWPHCCAVYCLGCPGSATLSVQLMGRALRLKCSTCPEIWRDSAAIVFFVPSVTEDGCGRVGRSHAARTLLMCGYLHDITNSHIFNEINTRLKMFQSLPGNRRQSSLGLSKQRMMINLLIAAIQETEEKNKVFVQDTDVERFVRDGAKKMGIPNAVRDAIMVPLRDMARDMGRVSEISEAIVDVKDTFVDAAAKYVGESSLLKAFCTNDIHRYLISLNSNAIRELGHMANELILPLTQFEKNELLGAAFLTRRRR